MEERREKDIVADDITDITLIQVGYYWNSGYNEFDFTCKIKGEDDVLHMREQRHDDGNSLVIRSEKDDIWERISTKEAFKLDDKLQEVIQYGKKKTEELGTKIILVLQITMLMVELTLTIEEMMTLMQR